MKKNSKKSVSTISKMVMDFLSTKYGIFYFDDNFKSEIKETVDWYDLDIFKSISHLVQKYEFKAI